MPDKPTKMRRAIMVLGMHRSGTSLLSNAISLLGPAQPIDQMPPQPDNPTGFGEPRGVTRFNDRVLKTIDATWDRPGPWYVAGETLPDARAALDEWLIATFAEEAAAVLRDSFPGTGDFVLKDPRLCLFAPLWRAAIGRVGATASVVGTARNPLAVAESLRIRNAMPGRRAVLLWQTYTLGALRTDPAMPVVDYDTLVAAPHETLATLAEALALPRPRGLAKRVDALVSADLAHHRPVADALAEAPLIPAAVRDLWALLGEWPGLTPDARTERLDALQARFDDALLLAGGGRMVPAVRAWMDRPRAPEPEPEPAIDPGPPPLIVHYHLFKNAGTSVDEMLKRNFGDGWAEQEFTAPGGRSNAAAVQEWLAARPGLAVLSSHTALMPLPAIEGVDIFPIIFLRHPLTRLRSAYKFERKQKADTFGATLAKAEDFAGYVATLLEVESNRQARSFQSYRFAFAAPDDGRSEGERARAALDILPFVGLVDRYDESLARLEALLRPRIPAFRAVSVRKNVTNAAPAEPLAAQLATIRAELGDALYDRAVAANADDIALFDIVSQRYDDAR